MDLATFMRSSSLGSELLHAAMRDPPRPLLDEEKNAQEQETTGKATKKRTPKEPQRTNEPEQDGQNMASKEHNKHERQTDNDRTEKPSEQGPRKPPTKPDRNRKEKPQKEEGSRVHVTAQVQPATDKYSLSCSILSHPHTRSRLTADLLPRQRKTRSSCRKSPLHPSVVELDKTREAGCTPPMTEVCG